MGKLHIHILDKINLNLNVLFLVYFLFHFSLFSFSFLLGKRIYFIFKNHVYLILIDIFGIC